MSSELTKKQRKQIYENMAKSKLAKMKFTLEDIKEINPVRKLIITDRHLISLKYQIKKNSAVECSSFNEITAALPENSPYSLRFGSEGEGMIKCQRKICIL